MCPLLEPVCPVAKLLGASTAATGVVHVVSGTALAVRAIVDGTTRAAAADAAHVLLGVVAIAPRVCCLSCVSAPASADGGSVMALGEGGAACSSSFDELDITTYCLQGCADMPMVTSLSSW